MSDVEDAITFVGFVGPEAVSLRMWGLMNTESPSEPTGRRRLRARDLIPVWFMIAFFSVLTLVLVRGLIVQVMNSEFDIGTWRSLSLIFFLITSVSLAVAFAFFARSRLRGPPV